MCFTLDLRMVQLPHVKEHQEESVWLVLQDRCQELIVEDQTELVSSAFVVPRSQTSTDPTKQILGCTKLAKMMDTSGYMYTFLRRQPSGTVVNGTKDRKQVFE